MEKQFAKITAKVNITFALIFLFIGTNVLFAKTIEDSLQAIVEAEREESIKSDIVVLKNILTPKMVVGILGDTTAVIERQGGNYYNYVEMKKRADKRYLPLLSEILNKGKQNYNITTNVISSQSWVKLHVLDILIEIDDSAVDKILKDASNNISTNLSKQKQHQVDEEIVVSRIKELVEITKTKIPAQKKEANLWANKLKTFSKTQDKKLVELADAINSDPYRFKYSAAIILAALAQFLDEKYPTDTRMLALSLMDRVAGSSWGGHYKTAIPLLKLVNDKNDGIRMKALEVLSKAQDAALLPALRYIAQNDRNEEIRSSAKNHIENMGFGLRKRKGLKRVEK